VAILVVVAVRNDWVKIAFSDAHETWSVGPCKRSLIQMNGPEYKEKLSAEIWDAPICALECDRSFESGCRGGKKGAKCTGLTGAPKERQPIQREGVATNNRGRSFNENRELDKAQGDAYRYGGVRIITDYQIR
jgi:hypothetical protein